SVKKRQRSPSRLPLWMRNDLRLWFRQRRASPQFCWAGRAAWCVVPPARMAPATARGVLAWRRSPGVGMSQLQDRIVQFRKMANDDPDNELGHFRLGQLLMEAGQHEDAVASFRRTLELSPQFSKVNQLLAASLIQLGRKDDAVGVLQQGFTVADE